MQLEKKIYISIPLLRNHLVNSLKVLLIYTNINNLYLKHELHRKFNPTNKWSTNKISIRGSYLKSPCKKALGIKEISHFAYQSVFEDSLMARKNVFKIIKSLCFSGYPEFYSSEPLGNTSLLSYVSANRLKIYGLQNIFLAIILGRR